MSKAVRIVVAAIFLIGILVVARSQMAWAGNPSAQNSGPVAQIKGVAASTDLRGRSTVKPPPVVVPPINEPGTYSAGGVCTVVVESIAEPMSLHVVLLPFWTVHDKPSEIQRYLAGVCSLTYVKRGMGVTDLAPEDGSVKVCFAAIPGTTNKIYVYDDHTWVAIDTTVENGLACAPATKTGKYVLAHTS